MTKAEELSKALSDNIAKLTEVHFAMSELKSSYGDILCRSQEEVIEEAEMDVEDIYHGLEKVKEVLDGRIERGMYNEAPDS